MIGLSHVRKVFPGSERPAVADLSLDVPEGEIATLVGPSGCGKSTTLRMINRLVEPTSGTITVGGRDVLEQAPHELRLGMGYVIQQVGLFPHRTVARNIATVAELLGWDKARTRARVEALINLVGLDQDLATRYPAQLSGGQQQRAAYDALVTTLKPEGVTAYKASAAEDKNGFVVTEETAKKYNLKKLSDLAKPAK